VVIRPGYTVALLITGGAVMVAMYGARAQGAAVRPTASPCVTSDSAYLTNSELGSFVRFVDQTQTRPPFFATNSSAPFVRDFVRERFIGFLSRRTLHGPGRTAIDERTKSLHYRLGKWPQVPLVGRVVRENSGVLEVYQTNWSFRSRTAAKAYIEQARTTRGSEDGVGTQVRSFGLRRGDESYAYTVVPTDPNQEHVVAAVMRFGTTVVTLRLQGGLGLSIGTIRELSRTLTAKLKNSCASHIQA